PIVYAPISRRNAPAIVAASQDEPASASASMDTSMSGPAASVRSEEMPAAAEDTINNSPDTGLREGTFLDDTARLKKRCQSLRQVQPVPSRCWCVDADLRCDNNRDEVMPHVEVGMLDEPFVKPHANIVPTPLGRRRLQPAPQEPVCIPLNELIPAEHVPATICLTELPARTTPESSGRVHETTLRVGVPSEAEAVVLDGFALKRYCRDKPQDAGMHPAAKRFLAHLPSCGPEDEPTAHMFYVDGSWDGVLGAWAVCCLSLVGDQWKWHGYLCDTMVAPLAANTPFDCELYAQFVALGTIACVGRPSTVFYDCTSAAAVAQGQAQTSAQTCIARGDPLNELVDGLAKRACSMPQERRGEVTEAKEVLRAFGDHFAIAEAATATALVQLPRNEGHGAAHGPTWLTGAPTLADLAASFASLSPGKASGISGIPPEAYQACAARAALVHMPLILKSISRLTFPRDLHDCFEKHTIRTIGGARKRFPADLPSLCVQAHAARLKKRGLAGSILFVDGVSAFYAAHRGHLFTQDACCLREYFDGLALEPSVRQRVLRAFHDTGALERAGVAAPTVLLLRAALARTWFSVDLTAHQVYATVKGTTPGSPVAAEGLAATISCKDVCVSATPQSWLDDVTILVTSKTPADVARDTSRAAALVCQYFAVAGIDVNFGIGKTEAVLCLHGAGSVAARTSVMVTQGGKISVPLPGNRDANLRCVDSYVHLGSRRDGRGNTQGEVERRARLTMEAFVPFRKRILCNRHLTLQEKQHLLASMIMSKFLHNAGTWDLHSKQAYQSFCSKYYSFLRGSIRPMCGVPCRRLSEEQILALTNALGPGEALLIRRVRLVSQVHDKADEYLLRTLADEQTWLQHVRSAVHELAAALEDEAMLEFASRPCDGLEWLRKWPYSRERTATKLKCFRRLRLGQRAELVPGAIQKAAAHQTAADWGLVFATIEAGHDGPDRAHSGFGTRFASL
ncbi:unnamed protein product, partial [Symbiodinium sp. CCMP2456]